MDHFGKITRKQNPREKANVFSLFTFAYTGGLFKKSLTRTLQEKDIYEVIKPCESKKNGDRFEKKWKIQKENHNMLKLLWTCFGWKYLIFGCIHLSNKLIHSIFEPQAIGKLVLYFKPLQTQVTFDDAIFYACGLVGLKVFHAFYYHNYRIYVQQMTIQIRTAFCSLIYRKSLRLTPEAMNDISLGNIITLITKDVLVFENSIMMFNEMWVEIIRLTVVSYLIYAQMGTAGFVGVGVVLIIVPAQVYIGKLIKDLRLELSKKTDERLQATQETLSAIKIIKMYTWESVFAQKVEEKRRKEMTYLLRSLYLWSLNFVIAGFMSKVGFYALIMTYIHLNTNASPEVIFYALKCFRDLKISVQILIPTGLGKGAELFAAGLRINKVLNSPELPEMDEEKYDKVHLNPIKCPKLKLNMVTVRIKEKEILKNITTELKPGLTVITGPLGSGKSSLLKSFLKDFPITSGQIEVEGNFSYCSQDPWLFPSSIKQNIVFGEPFDEDRYHMVLKVCALEYDLNLFEKGDETIVQDRGMNLSGGQQARVNLARAIYKKSDIYLLDEPLHALDAKVQDFIFQNCIQGFLKHEYVIMVSHDLRHRDNADHFLVINEGRLVFDGKPLEVNPEILKKIEAEKQSLEDLSEDEETKNVDIPEIVRRKFSKRKIYAETQKEGTVDWNVYKKYFIFGGGFAVFSVIFFLFLGAEITESYALRLMTDWLNFQQNLISIKINSTNENFTETHELEVEMSKISAESEWTLKLYSSMIVLTVIIDLLKRFSFINFCRKASVNLHNSMISKLSTAMMTFFDNYFIGNILNRFSQDLSVIDESLPHMLTIFLGELVATGAVITLISTVYWQFIIPAVLLLVSLFGLRSIYMPTARSLKRLEAATRSPLIGHLNASMEGVTTIRANRAQRILEEEFDRHLDLFTSAHYMTFCVRRAFGFFMDILCAVFLMIVVGKLLFFNSGESSGNVGLAITEAASLASIIHYFLLYWAELENDMTSVERVLEYTEAAQEDHTGQTIEKWPSKGTVSYDEVSLQYKEEKVLKEISFQVNSKEKIGITGRTGAGKTSIISTLFRLYRFEGNIKIDGIDTKIPSLRFLRDNISIIPQEPLLFQGTIRQNIDPLKRYTDQEIWHTLEKVYMISQIETLDMMVEEHGSNFSTGERQLICLARAIIRKNKIVVLDEATSNMDLETELLVQTVIERQFLDSTVFIIAHRLQSVLRCHKVMVMEKGEIIEFDNPTYLLENPTSFFAKMVFLDRERSLKID